MSIHPVFHVSLLDRYKEPIACQQPSEPLLVIVEEEEEEYKVDRMLDSRHRYIKSFNISFNMVDTTIYISWEPAEHLANSSELVEEFHREHLDKPRSERRPSRPRQAR